MYTLLALGMEGIAPGNPRDRIDWEAYGFDAHIRYADTTHMEEAIRTQKPDAVLLDIDGVKDMGILGEIGYGCHACPYVIISRETDSDHIRRAMRAGAFDYCVKPVTRENLSEILRALKERLDERAKCPAIQDERLAGIVAYMAARFHEKLTLAGVAEAFHMSKNYLCYYFKLHMGVNFVDYLTSLRIKKAKVYLVSSMTLDEIAEKTGFSDTPYFIKVFKKYEGISPGAYRKSVRT